MLFVPFVLVPGDVRKHNIPRHHASGNTSLTRSARPHGCLPSHGAALCRDLLSEAGVASRESCVGVDARLRQDVAGHAPLAPQRGKRLEQNGVRIARKPALG